MTTRYLFTFIAAAILLSSCKFECSLGKNNEVRKGKTPGGPKTVNGAIVSNDIDISARGVKLKSASLRYEDNRPVADDNTIALNQKIYLALELEDNWKVENGKCFIGASEKIMQADGSVIVDADDLFGQAYPDGIDTADARLVSLSAKITRDAPNNDYYKVTFRAWDKKGDGEITGSYKFYIK